jgi:hypothetical protein
MTAAITVAVTTGPRCSRNIGTRNIGMRDELC